MLVVASSKQTFVSLHCVHSQSDKIGVLPQHGSFVRIFYVRLPATSVAQSTFTEGPRELKPGNLSSD
jgi:hypothetical protein